MQVRAVKVSLTAAERGAQRDLHQLVDAERHVLAEGPVRADDVRPAQRLADVRGRLRRPDRGEPVPAHDEVPGPVLQVDHRVRLGGQPDQALVPDELHVPADRGEAARRPPPRPGPSASAAVGPAFGCGSLFPLPCSSIRLGQVGGDARDHLGQLDRDGRVMDEVDEHGQVDDHQPERDRHADVRHELAVRPDPDRGQHQYPRTRNVATNVPRVSWVPRSRMKFRSIRGPNWVEASRQGDQDDGEDHADHGDNGGGDGGEDLPGRVRAAADHPAGQG